VRKSIPSGSATSRNARRPYPRSRRVFPFFWMGILSSIAVLLAIIATLQFRSSTEIKDAEQARVGTDLESVMIKWHLDFYGEFSNVCVALQIGPDSGERDSWEDYLHRYAHWSNATNRADSLNNLYRNRDLVKDIYIWETSSRSSPKLLRLNATQDRIENSAIPPKLQFLLAHLQRNSSSLLVALNAWRPDNPASTASAESEEPPSTSRLLRGNAETGWQFDEKIPVLVHPIFHYSQHRAIDTETLSSVDPVDWVVVVLNLDTIQQRILPELTERYFSGPKGLEYRVAVITAGKNSQLLYSSDPGFGAKDLNSSDSVMDIFGPPPQNTEGNLRQIENLRTSLKGKDWHRFSSPVWFPVIEPISDDGPWLLILQNRKGPLEAMVARVWHRNLLAGGVVLLLLAVSMVLVVVASQRAQALANLQMDFVASVSHELRTPLAVILSAGENIRDGLVNSRKMLTQQGTIITEQAHQLMNLVDDVLLFASSAKGIGYAEPRPLQVSDIVESALRNTSGLLEKEGFTVTEDIPTGLPRVAGDLSALSQCLENLIVNAVKYSNRDRWIGLCAAMDEGPGEREGVRISVEDHGVGISSSDLQQIFEPFYRCPEAIAAQIHGTGLGLSIAKRVAEAFGGRLSVFSDVGVGSVFTLHLVVSDELPEATATSAGSRRVSP
jgi:signal transduction histidine kinase